MKEIGGYFEIEKPNIVTGIHYKALRLNSGRNCFEYILLANKYTKVYIPYYTCEVLLEPLKKHNIEYDFYNIDYNFEPFSLPKLNVNEALLYTNYFGLKASFINELRKLESNLIIDNSHALFEEPLDVDTFYSLRKFAGTADGAFLYCTKKLDIELLPAASFDRVSHLYLRKDISASAGYPEFKKNDASLSGLPIMSISSSTNSFIDSYDFEKNKCIRERNFLYLHSALGKFNKIKHKIFNLNAPLCYPLLVDDEKLKVELIKNNVFVPTYWPNVLDWLPDKECWERKLVNNLVCVPIDQRYNLNDLLRIINIIRDLYEKN